MFHSFELAWCYNYSQHTKQLHTFFFKSNIRWKFSKNYSHNSIHWWPSNLIRVNFEATNSYGKLPNCLSLIWIRREWGRMECVFIRKFRDYLKFTVLHPSIIENFVNVNLCARRSVESVAMNEKIKMNQQLFASNI